MEIKIGDKIIFKNGMEGIITKVYGDGFILTTHYGNYYKIYKYSNDKLNEIEYLKRPTKYETIYENKDILDKEEKEYLNAVIKPFKEKVSYIVKHAEISDYGGEEICIYHKCMSGEFSNEIILPSFEAGTMYKGMELYKEYTLEELGLWK